MRTRFSIAGLMVVVAIVGIVFALRSQSDAWSGGLFLATRASWVLP